MRDEYPGRDDRKWPDEFPVNYKCITVIGAAHSCMAVMLEFELEVRQSTSSGANPSHGSGGVTAGQVTAVI